jgi:hypothetical protein
MYSLGANAFRIPFGWQYLQPTLGGELDASFAWVPSLSRSSPVLETKELALTLITPCHSAALDVYVQAAIKTGGYAILDLHNCSSSFVPIRARFREHRLADFLPRLFRADARLNSGVVGVDGPSNAQVSLVTAENLPFFLPPTFLFLHRPSSSPISGLDSPRSTLLSPMSSSDS